MKKIITKRKFWETQRPIAGIGLPEYGIPYYCGGGMIPEENVDHALAAVEKYPGFHIASFNEEGWGYNMYKPGLEYYMLCTGDADPELEFTPHGNQCADITIEDVKRFEALCQEMWDTADEDPQWVLIAGDNKWNPGR